jgi:drug/metabolite transporter (DMT)-like permease
LLDSAANVSYLLATREGLLSVVAVVASLYPAGTVFLARVVLGERLGPQRLAGVAAALVAVALIAI